VWRAIPFGGIMKRARSPQTAAARHTGQGFFRALGLLQRGRLQQALDLVFRLSTNKSIEPEQGKAIRRGAKQLRRCYRAADLARDLVQQGRLDLAAMKLQVARDALSQASTCRVALGTPGSGTRDLWPEILRQSREQLRRVRLALSARQR